MHGGGGSSSRSGLRVEKVGGLQWGIEGGKWVERAQVVEYEEGGTNILKNE